ncbi:inactive protein RESTRICTED TEV MOVEMENT 2-like isoform X2 [Prosopis cineraria]|nr:inactive protein RESTRICTED TEV MOVEMENT 2-like isoform X2 [Prosopis cineraria]
MRRIRVSGERQIEGNIWRRFYSEFPVPQDSDTNNIGAKFERGTLYVRFPKLITPVTPQPPPTQQAPSAAPPPRTQQPPPPPPPPPSPPKPRTREEPKAEQTIEKKPETRDQPKIEQKEKEPPKEEKQQAKEKDISQGKGLVEEEKARKLKHQKQIRDIFKRKKKNPEGHHHHHFLKEYWVLCRLRIIRTPLLAWLESSRSKRQ